MVEVDAMFSSHFIDADTRPQLDKGSPQMSSSWHKVELVIETMQLDPQTSHPKTPPWTFLLHKDII